MPAEKFCGGERANFHEGQTQGPLLDSELEFTVQDVYGLIELNFISCHLWIQVTFEKFKNKILSTPLHQNPKVPAYKIRTYVLNSLEFGLPQNRARMYMIGVRQSGKGLKRPMPKVKKPNLKKPHLKHFILPDASLTETPKKLAKKAKVNVKWAKKKLAEDKMKIEPGDDAVVDTAAGKSFRQVQVGRCPTITKARGATPSFWLLRRRRSLDVISKMFLNLRRIFNLFN